jgi:hypothetical protein
MVYPKHIQPSTLNIEVASALGVECFRFLSKRSINHGAAINRHTPRKRDVERVEIH